MINKVDRNKSRKIRAMRVRKKISGTSECPRLNVFKSLKKIYAQIIDDSNNHTLLSVSSLDKDVASKIAGKTKTESAFIVGQVLAKKATKKGITNVVFDRAGYIYTGRVKSLAEGARDGGLQF